MSLTSHLNACSNLILLNLLINNLESQIGCLGGRRFKDSQQNYTGTLSLNDLVKKLSSLSSGLNSKDSHNITYAKGILGRIRRLDSTGNDLLKIQNCFYRILTALCRFFGNLCYDREATLSKMEQQLSKFSSTEAAGKGGGGGGGFVDGGGGEEKKRAASHSTGKEGAAKQAPEESHAEAAAKRKADLATRYPLLSQERLGFNEEALKKHFSDHENLGDCQIEEEMAGCREDMTAFLRRVPFVLQVSSNLLVALNTLIRWYPLDDHTVFSGRLKTHLPAVIKKPDESKRHQLLTTKRVNISLDEDDKELALLGVTFNFEPLQDTWSNQHDPEMTVRCLTHGIITTLIECGRTSVGAAAEKEAKEKTATQGLALKITRHWYRYRGSVECPVFEALLPQLASIPNLRVLDLWNIGSMNDIELRNKIYDTLADMILHRDSLLIECTSPPAALHSFPEALRKKWGEATQAMAARKQALQKAAG